jgi:hypothetical protein
VNRFHYENAKFRSASCLGQGTDPCRLHDRRTRDILIRMEVTLAVLADYANVTKDGKLNVMGIFAHINARVLPYVHPQMLLVWEAEAGPAEWGTRKDVEVKLLDEAANQILSVRGNPEVPRGKPGRPVRINSVMAFNNVKFDAEGDYVFSVLIGGEVKKNVSFRLSRTPPGAKA